MKDTKLWVAWDYGFLWYHTVKTSKGYQHFGETSRIHFNDIKTPMMEAAGGSETLTHVYQTFRCSAMLPLITGTAALMFRLYEWNSGSAGTYIYQTTRRHIPDRTWQTNWLYGAEHYTRGHQL
jgi:hypothetical protein